MDADQELLAVFRAEVDEQIDDLCSRLGRKPDGWRIDKLFQIAHNIKGAARLVGIDSIRDTAHPLEDLFSAVRDGRELSEEMVSVARMGGDLLDSCFRAIDGGQPPDLQEFRTRLRLCLGDGVADFAEVENKSADQTPAKELDAAVRETGDTTEGRQAQTTILGKTIRVGADKLDTLMDTASELVSHVFQAEGHTRAAKELEALLIYVANGNPELKSDLTQALYLSRDLGARLKDHENEALRLSDEFQTSIRSLRMVRIDGLRTVLSRSVREACTKEGRLATLHISGAETEIDRAVLDELRDPLIHAVRNAVAHGIETPEQRRAFGKPESGIISIEARSAGSSVEIVIADDGRGINIEQVKKRAGEKAAVASGEIDELSDFDTMQLLFEPGFSTAESVTDIAGRGVGLDVVKGHLRNLGGDARIASTFGVGTQLTLRVPLTRLTTTGVVIRLGDQIFACPAADIDRTLQVSRKDMVQANGLDMIPVDGDLVQLSHLAKILGYAIHEADEKPAIVLSDGLVRRALLVDQVIGQREFIVRPVSWHLQGMKGIAGATVLDGSEVVLILDRREILGTKSDGGWDEIHEQHKHRILVVDDSVTSRTLECNILRSAGYTVESAVDGEQAFSLLEDTEFDLVLSDVEMPKVNGLELTRLIRGDERFEHLPVILVTSLASEKDREEGAEAGADAYIVKGSFDQEELLRTVARLL